MPPHSFPFRPTHIVRVLPLHRALALLLVEQGNLLGLQSCDGLRSMILGIEMDLLNLEEGTQVVILRVWECPSLSNLHFYRAPSWRSVWFNYHEGSGLSWIRVCNSLLRVTLMGTPGPQAAIGTQLLAGPLNQRLLPCGLCIDVLLGTHIPLIALPRGMLASLES